MDTARMLSVLDEIAADMKNDAANFDGQPFNGRTVAEYFGNQGAAIAALAGIVKALTSEVDAAASRAVAQEQPSLTLRRMDTPKNREFWAYVAQAKDDWERAAPEWAKSLDAASRAVPEEEPQP